MTNGPPRDPPNWDTREKRMAEGPAAPATVDTDDWPFLEPRLFRTRDGQVWLARMTLALDQALGPSPGEPLLRYLEAQRDILRRIRRNIHAAQTKESAT